MIALSRKSKVNDLEKSQLRVEYFVFTRLLGFVQALDI